LRASQWQHISFRRHAEMAQILVPLCQRFDPAKQVFFARHAGDLIT